ncbi:MAG TPA: hypothetical protein DDY31_18050 [Lachnospiraceae bacterium]|nr:hypothetical protein [Lachnospiraceae bacterium]
MDTKLILDIIGDFFEILLAYLFFQVFFSGWRIQKKSAIIIFILVFACKLAGSYYLPEAWMKTAWALLCYLTITFCYHGTFLSKILMTLFFWATNVIVEYGVHGFLMFSAGEIYATGNNRLQDYAIGLMLSKLILMFFYFLLFYYVKHKNEQILATLEHKWYLAFLLYPSITVVILIQQYYLILENQNIDSLNRFLFTSVLLILSNLIIFRILNEMQHLQAVKLQAEFAEQQLNSQEKHYAELVEKNSAIKKQVHDTKNFLLILQSYIQQNKRQQALDQLQSMLNTVGGDLIEYTENIVLDTVLSAKIQEASRQQINIIPAVALYGTLAIKTIDLALLLGNALDNAIEATVKVSEPERKKIWLTMKLQENILHIILKNPVKEHVAIHNQSIPTSKQNNELHGLGITNMKTIVDKYRGTFDIRCSEQQFILNIVLENEAAT